MNKISLSDLEGLFAEVIDLSGAVFSPDGVLGEDIPADSKEMLRILSRIEAHYRFRFRPADILKLRTVGDLLEAVRQNSAGVSSGGKAPT